ncbi:MAG: hypothetical protein RSE18_01830 [Acinetobacter sp.]
MSNIASPMPQIRAKFTNKLGIPLSGCKVYTYEPNSDIPKTTWLDIDKTTENTNPILLDAAGEADIFLDGLYRVVVKDRFGFVVYDVEKTGTHTEWDASFVVDASGLTQQQINNYRVKVVESFENLSEIKNPENNNIVYISDIDEFFKYENSEWLLNAKNEVNLKDFPRLNAELDDTNRFYRALDATKFYDGTSPAQYSIYARSELVVPTGYYQISDEIVLDQFVTSIKSSGKAIIKQTNPDKNIFSHNNVWSCDFNDIKFIGGKHHIYLQNPNRDASVVTINDCEHHYSSDYAIKTWGTGAGDNHLSMSLTINNPKFIKPNGILYNVCDIATINGGWAFPDKQNFSADRAVIVNRYGVLQMNSVLGVPSMGVGTDRLDRVRWVDNYGRFQAHQTRFGGEDHGIPVVYAFKPEFWLQDNMGTSVIIRDCQTYCGLSYEYPASGACVIYLEESVPQQIILEGNNYQLAVPYIASNPTLDLDTYFPIAAANRKKYKFKIDTNMTWGEDSFGVPYPIQLNEFMNGGKVDENIHAFKPISEGLIAGTAKHKATYSIPKEVKAFTLIATISSNFSPSGSTAYRKTASFMISMNTDWDGVSQKNILTTQVLMRSEGQTPAADVISISAHFGNNEMGSTSRNNEDGGEFSLVFDNCKDITIMTVIPLAMS